jgi:hypothetical protein
MNGSAKVFLLANGGNLSAMKETPYKAEDVLQEYLTRYPDLLPGDQINPDNPCRWLLICREMGVPGEEDAADRWSLDHLFVDQDGIPTFVECKRSSDTRVRREVVAQMLDYAANATQYWPMEKLRQSAAETAQRNGQDLDTVLLDSFSIEDPEEIEAFWQKVEDNLKEGQIRLVFVSDSIPRELRRIVEFLDNQMERTQVLAVEIKQFIGEGARVIAPRVLGTPKATIEPTTGRKPPLTPEKFFAQCDPLAKPFFEKMLEEAKTRSWVIYWGSSGFSVKPPDWQRATMYGYISGYFNPHLHEAWPMEPAARENIRRQLLAVAPFRESGKYTLEMKLNQDNLPKAFAALDLLFAEIEKMVASDR